MSMVGKHGKQNKPVFRNGISVGSKFIPRNRNNIRLTDFFEVIYFVWVKQRLAIVYMLELTYFGCIACVVHNTNSIPFLN